MASPSRRLKGAATDGSMGPQRVPLAGAGGCRRVPLLLDAGPKTQQAGQQAFKLSSRQAFKLETFKPSGTLWDSLDISGPLCGSLGASLNAL